MPTDKEIKDGTARFYGPKVHNDGRCSDAEDAIAFATAVHAYFTRETDQDHECEELHAWVTEELEDATSQEDVNRWCLAHSLPPGSLKLTEHPHRSVNLNLELLHRLRQVRQESQH
jgi:hypothetical protein